MGACCSGPRKDDQAGQIAKAPSAVQGPQRTWMATGIVTLRDVGQSETCFSRQRYAVQGIPKSVLANVDRVRVLDVSNNKLTELPTAVETMINVERLVGANNRIMVLDVTFGDLKKLKVLDLDDNKIEALPQDLGNCAMLETVSLRSNRLRSIPSTLQHCKRLKTLDVAHNLLTCLPPPIGNCSALESIDAGGNLLLDIPGALSRLSKLRVLILRGNSDLRGIPGEILEDCGLLHTLDLHDTQVTRQVLQETDGYEAFERRRRAKASKAIDGGAMARNNGLDEGIDVQLK